MRKIPLFALPLFVCLAVGCGTDDDSGTRGGTGGGVSDAGAGGVDGAGAAADSSAGAGGESAAAGGSAGTPACDDGSGGEAPVEMLQHEGNWQIMLLGDSITQSTCYPQLLSKVLIEQGRDQFDFIGGRITSQGCGADAPSVPTEGHGSYLVTDLLPGGAHEGELEAWLAALRPEPVGASGAGGSGSAGGGAGDDIIAGGTSPGGAGGAGPTVSAIGLPEVAVVHFGTNDAWNGRSTARILDAYTFVVEELRAANPDVIMLFAQIIPLAPTEYSCSACPGRVEDLDAAIPAWAEANSTARSPIHVVDVHTCFDVVADTRDGVHPNPEGSQKMADDFATGLHRAGIL